MIEFILNDESIETDLPQGTTVLDFVRYYKNLKGTKIGCREGDCGACTVLVGELIGEKVNYRTMTSCLMPLANAPGKHIVTIEGINPENGDLTPVQQAILDESGTQCGFCTVGFVMSLTGFCIDDTEKTCEMAVSSIDGNICRCTGYKSIERAAAVVNGQLSVVGVLLNVDTHLSFATEKGIVPKYFSNINEMITEVVKKSSRPLITDHRPLCFVGGGTDVYVQKPDELADTDAAHLFYNENLRGIRDTGEFIEIGASATVTDLLVSPMMQNIFPDLYKHLKLVSSTPIRNMATLAGNFINASPIGDMTVWFLALDAEIDLNATKGGNASVNERANSADGTLLDSRVSARLIRLRDFYLGYKQLAKSDDEIITTIRFKKPTADFRFNFEKVCKRTYLDIATVNTAISLKSSPPYEGEVAAVSADRVVLSDIHVAAGGVAPIPLYLKETSSFLNGKEINEETIAQANEIMQSEISPISDVRGTKEYKRFLLRQLFRAHFVEIFDSNL